MALVVASSHIDAARWRACLRTALGPDRGIIILDDEGRPDVDDVPVDTVRYALLWGEATRFLPRYPGVQVAFSYGAGVEHIINAPEIPKDMPLVRMVDPSLRQGMVEFVLLRVLHHHRRIPVYQQQQAARQWIQHLDVPLASERSVGVLGAGQLGMACAAALASIGFRVSVYARRQRAASDLAPGVSYVTDLSQVLAVSQYLVNLLPLTPATSGILDATAFHQLPRGAVLISVARGKHVVDADMLSALASGHLAAADLDVFEHEPLSPQSPLWSAPGVSIFPHISALTMPDTASRVIAEGIRLHQAGLPLPHLVDRQLGY